MSNSNNEDNYYDDDHDENDNCPDCIQRKKEAEELEKEILMIAPPQVREIYETINDQKKQEAAFSVTPKERTEEEKKRDEEERIKLEEWKKKRKSEMAATAKANAAAGIIHISERDLEDSIAENKPKLEQPDKKQQQQQQTHEIKSAPKGKKPVKKKPIKKPTPLKMGTIVNPEPGPPMDCDD